MQPIPSLSPSLGLLSKPRSFSLIDHPSIFFALRIFDLILLPRASFDTHAATHVASILLSIQHTDPPIVLLRHRAASIDRRPSRQTLHGRRTISNKCWTKRPAYLMKQFSLLEIISTVVLLAIVVVDSSRVFHAVDSATLQATHRCTPAPHGIPAVPVVLPTGPKQEDHGLWCQQAWQQCGDFCSAEPAIVLS